MISEVEMPLTGLVQVHGVGLWGAQQVQASQGLAGRGLGALGGVSRPLLHEAGLSGERRGVAGGVKAGAPLGNCRLRPAGGRSKSRLADGQKMKQCYFTE